MLAQQALAITLCQINPFSSFFGPKSEMFVILNQTGILCEISVPGFSSTERVVCADFGPPFVPSWPHVGPQALAITLCHINPFSSFIPPNLKCLSFLNNTRILCERYIRSFSNTDTLFARTLVAPFVASWPYVGTQALAIALCQINPFSSFLAPNLKCLSF